VVAANDGVKPQTLEAIRHIKKAGVTCIVAINKMDVEGANPINVKSQLAEQEMVVTDFGGDIEAVEISAKTGVGVDKLLETLVLTAELLELKADPDGELQAVVIESFKDKMRGAVADIIVQNGTLRLREEVFVTDMVSGRIKAIVNDLGKNENQLGPSDPGEIIGLNEAPTVGATLVSNQALATELHEQEKQGNQVRVGGKKNQFANLDFSVFEGGDQAGAKKIVLVLKADTRGTLEAMMQNLDSEAVQIVGSGVGAVNDTDLELARTSGARIISFQQKVEPRILGAGKDLGVKIKQYQVIYELIEDLQKKILKIMEPTIDEKVVGEAEILQIFEMKGMRIAGIKVRTGEIKKSDLLHLKRKGEIVTNPVINSMMRNKLETTAIKDSEGAVTFKNKRLDFAVGDMLVAYIKEDF
jgi:translation initiation factor IF-2